ncbi:MAG: TauD/TfdA family dioxygenase [Thiohalobacteraceae bacterium]
MQIHPLSPLGGITVAGVDLRTPVSAAFDAPLQQLYAEHGIVVFRGQTLSKAELVAAGEHFGGTLINKEAVAPDPEAPGITVISTRGPFGDTMPEDQDEVVGDLEWHTDQGYVVSPIRGKILYAVQVPDEGGLTGFIDGQLTYEALPDDLKARIDGLHVIQSWNRSEEYLARNRDYRIKGHQEMTRDRFPDLSFPIVLAHPVTGAKILNVPPLWSAGIVEMPGAEGDALLATLVDFVKQPRFQYWHRYTVGDAVLWDNWRFVHAAGGTPGRYVRTLWAINIKGGPVLGEVIRKAA